ncbi:MAG: iron ABC transporter ATP-binding protein [Bacillota bacterium]|nr:MAG: iron ABC transporter ATP-binding protein [Bacillota bacterium]
MVEVKNLSKAYGTKWVLRNVSLRVRRRTITALIGPNGAGKSTLMGVMSRLLKKDGGEIWIDGKEIGSYKSRELAKKISVLRQTNDVRIRITVRELVSFGRFPHTEGRLRKEDWDWVDRAIAYMELDTVQDRFLDELSGGQKQRAFIAMVLAQDTDYVLLDEPLNSLDMKHAVQMMKVLRRMVDELDKTVVVALHDINFASVYADEIVAMKDGRVVKQGRSEEVIESDVLREIYDMDVAVQTIGGQRVCMYYQ